jgi:hypothetical protein
MGIFKRETTGPELAEAEPETETEMEGELREFVRREVEVAPRHPENEGTVIADNISSLLQRVSATSLQEIDALIDELKILRERLHNDGMRVHRQIVQYASLNQAAMQSTKAIADSLGNWKRRGPGAPGIDDGT